MRRNSAYRGEWALADICLVLLSCKSTLLEQLAATSDAYKRPAL